MGEREKRGEGWKEGEEEKFWGLGKEGEGKWVEGKGCVKEWGRADSREEEERGEIGGRGIRMSEVMEED